MDVTELSTLIALTLGVGWASGINLYAAVLALGMAGATGYADLPAGLEIVQNPLVIGAAGLMYAVEFFADKVPGVDTGWDTLHTFIRLPAGALLAAGIFDDQSMGLELAAAIVGGGLAATSHATKAGSRVLINTSPEPFTNWTASIAEDISVFGGVWLMLNQPWTFVGLLIVFLLLLVWLLPKLWRGIKVLFAKIRGIFVSKPVQAEPVQAADVQSKSDP
ncbi:MAG: DUF4126 domain-containing protein [Pseudomonadales bacterium]|nr:DUF4126 domain-containing protein [Pseudomonadales bacterium]